VAAEWFAKVDAPLKQSLFAVFATFFVRKPPPNPRMAGEGGR